MGLAGTDALGMLAHPVETVAGRPWPEAARRIAEVVGERGAEVVVMGLGAQSMMNATQASGAAAAAGSPDYMAPELLSGSVEANYSTDVYWESRDYKRTLSFS